MCNINGTLAVHLIYTDSTFVMYWQNNESSSIKHISTEDLDKQVIMIAMQLGQHCTWLRSQSPFLFAFQPWSNQSKYDSFTAVLAGDNGVGEQIALTNSFLHCLNTFARKN